ncbi:hypothetical protein ACFY7C_37365 [Streptomyces sp. NPDC012769]|uniref:DUF7302 family protein n=1 Tax=Streptomyces sp. NPDC012769 TaxID=3364848 RepID=UPI0036CA131C
MRIRMRVTLPGSRNGAPWPAKGATLDVPDDEAEQLIRYGAADPAEPPPADPPASKRRKTEE